MQRIFTRKPPIRRRILRWTMAALGLAVAVCAGWFGWYLMTPALDLLPRAAAGATAVVENAASPLAAEFPERRIRDLGLDGGRLGTVRLSLSLPDPLPRERLPVSILLGGLRTGRDNIGYVRDPGRNALVGYQYPLPSKIRVGWDQLGEVPALRRRALSVPGQILVLLDWLRAQPWADAQRISLVGVSLGALYLPAVQHLAQSRGVAVENAVIAYGGVDIGALATHRLWDASATLRWAAGTAVSLGLRPLEPARHLPKLHGAFLLLGSADQDKYIPVKSSQRLFDLTPEPKTMLRLEGGHIDNRRSTLAAEVVTAAGAWLAERGAGNP